MNKIQWLYLITKSGTRYHGSSTHYIRPQGRPYIGGADLPALRVTQEFRDELNRCSKRAGLIPSEARRRALEKWVKSEQKKYNK